MDGRQNAPHIVQRGHGFAMQVISCIEAPPNGWRGSTITGIQFRKQSSKQSSLPPIEDARNLATRVAILATQQEHTGKQIIILSKQAARLSDWGNGPSRNAQGLHLQHQKSTKSVI